MHGVPHTLLHTVRSTTEYLPDVNDLTLGIGQLQSTPYAHGQFAVTRQLNLTRRIPRTIGCTNLHDLSSIDESAEVAGRHRQLP